MNIRLVTVDEHMLLRLGLARMATACLDIDVVGEAGTAAAAIEVIDRTAPSVVTLDVALPDADGMALARRLRRTHPRVGLVLLSASTDDTLLYRAMDEGLSAYVTKAAPAALVLAAIRHASAAPESFTAPGMSAALARRRATTGLLSHRERQVLGLMRDGISLPGIASQLGVSEATVKTYVSRLYTKLQVNNRSQALMTAVNQGLLTYAEAA
jgi:DNA-binding NarL/FixJ family response regulator